MEALWNVIGKINTALWSNPMLFLALGSGLIFTICLRFVQVRKLKTMVGLLFNGKASDHGLSSFQAFTLAIAGRVGTGNIVGVATAICAGGRRPVLDVDDRHRGLRHHLCRMYAVPAS